MKQPLNHLAQEKLLLVAGKRVYLDRGRKQDYGRFWAAIFAMKNSRKITDHLQECFWYNGNEKENLITEFIRN